MAILAEEMRAEQGWQGRFNDPRSDRVLSELADVALQEHRRGQTRPMNPGEL